MSTTPDSRRLLRVTYHQVRMYPADVAITVKVVRRSLLARALRKVTGMQAITPWFAVHVATATITAQYLEHEFEHVRQIWRHCPVWRGRRIRPLGVVRFAIEYLRLYRKHGYAKHPLEQAARQAAGQPLR